jgi:hypothetical protein
MSPGRPSPLAAARAASIALFPPAAGQLSGRTQRLRVYDGLISIKLRHANAGDHRHAQPGDDVAGRSCRAGRPPIGSRAGRPPR